MRILLDTHTLAWAIGQADFLSKKVRELLENPAVKLLISPVSIWEMSIKYKLGKWLEVAPFMDEDLYHQFIQELNAEELLVSSRHTRLAGQFDMSHKDPFDRLLVAQAVLEGIPIVSKDNVLDAFPITRVWS
jgi:PIN domain nuclease of toxin-antitoxin system